MPVNDDGSDDDDYRQTYNFAPGYYGLVYRADAPDHHTQSSQHTSGPDERPTDGDARSEKEHNGTDETSQDVDPTSSSKGTSSSPSYKLQSMKWGLVPFWTKRNPDYTSTMKTINCRDDSLAASGGMWNTMKQNKRCIILAQGFYEWLKKPNNPKEKIPHYVKRKDGKLMCFAGLFDRVVYEDAPEGKKEPLYTYTIITTDSNKQLNFLHDRMPVILENGSPEMFMWLDNAGHGSWGKELQSLLKPYMGELECYPVSKDVGKVGNNSPTFIVPVNSTENKNNIANFFSGAKKAAKTEEVKKEVDEVKHEVDEKGMKIEHEDDAPANTVAETGLNEENNAPMPVPATAGVKREHEDDEHDDSQGSHLPDQHVDKMARTTSPVKQVANVHKRSRNAMSNNTMEKAAAKKASPAKASDGTKKITSFFGK